MVTAAPPVPLAPSVEEKSYADANEMPWNCRMHDMTMDGEAR
jgi:hypothetical protein